MGFVNGVYAKSISNIAAVVIRRITVENLAIGTTTWDPHAIPGPDDRREVTTDDEEVVGVHGLAKVTKDTIGLALTVNPLETVAVEIQFKESQLLSIELIEIGN
jgi:hypothetical protein